MEKLPNNIEIKINILIIVVKYVHSSFVLILKIYFLSKHENGEFLQIFMTSNTSSINFEIFLF